MTADTSAVVLRHVGIVVSDLDKAARIFIELFGFEMKADYPTVEGRFISSLVGLDQVEVRIAILRMPDNNRIELLEYRSPTSQRLAPPRANDLGLSHLAIRVKDLNEIYSRSTAYEICFVNPPMESPNGSVKVAYAVLMTEILVELVQVYDEKARYSGGK